MFQPIAVFVAVTFTVYFWWLLGVSAWGIKTKYILFLVPAYVAYAMVGLEWVSDRLPTAGRATELALVALVALTQVYLFAFALG